MSMCERPRTAAEACQCKKLLLAQGKEEMT